MQQFFHYDVPAGENTFNGCLGCAHGDSIVTSQWQFVSFNKCVYVCLWVKKTVALDLTVVDPV